MKRACLNENTNLHEPNSMRVFQTNSNWLSILNGNSSARITSMVLSMLLLILVLGGCTTGRYFAGNYGDDIYFTPGDIIATTQMGETDINTQETTVLNEQLIISNMETNDDGSKTLNNYIYEDENQQTQFNMDNMELVGSDTTQYLNEDSIKYVINNYYEGTDLDFEYRINRFHRPFFYNSFYWNDWYYNDWYYSPYLSWNYYGSWGYNPFYSHWYGYNPYYSWYNPYYSWGWPYYAGAIYSGGYWNNHGGGGHIGNGNYDYGRRSPSYSTAADRRDSGYSSTVSRTRGTELKSGSSANRADIEGQDTYNHGVRASRSGMTQDVKSATIMDRRRTSETLGTENSSSSTRNSGRTGTSTVQTQINTNRNNSSVNRSYSPSSTGQTYQRNTSTQQRSYVPSYNKPRTVTRSTYNSESFNKPENNASNYSPRSETRRNVSVIGSNSRSQGNPSSVKSSYKSGSTYNQGSSSSSGSSSRSSSNSSPEYRSNSNYDAGRSSNYSSGSSGYGSSGSSSSGSSSSSSSSGSSGGGDRSGSSSGRR